MSLCEKTTTHLVFNTFRLSSLCQKFFVETRKKIKEFFDYADCADKDKLNAETLFKSVFFNKLDLKFKK